MAMVAIVPHNGIHSIQILVNICIANIFNEHIEYESTQLNFDK